MPAKLTGYMLFLPNGKPLNCVGSWRVFQCRADATKYLSMAYRKANGITLDPVEVLAPKKKEGAK